MGSESTETRSNMKLDDLVEGAIDVHIHSGPDSVERWGDTIDIARLALANRQVRSMLTT